MERDERPLIAHAILSAPGWARVGISDPKPSLREDAAMELAASIARALDDPPTPASDDQPRLAL